MTHLRRANSPRSSLTHAHARLDMAAAAAAGDSDSWGEEKLGGRAGTGRRWPQTVINATLFPQTRTRSQWKTRCGRWGAAALPAGGCPVRICAINGLFSLDLLLQKTLDSFADLPTHLSETG